MAHPSVFLGLLIHWTDGHQTPKGPPHIKRLPEGTGPGLLEA